MNAAHGQDSSVVGIDFDSPRRVVGSSWMKMNSYRWPTLPQYSTVGALSPRHDAFSLLPPAEHVHVQDVDGRSSLMSLYSLTLDAAQQWHSSRIHTMPANAQDESSRQWRLFQPGNTASSMSSTAYMSWLYLAATCIISVHAILVSELHATCASIERCPRKTKVMQRGKRMCHATRTRRNRPARHHVSKVKGSDQ